MSARNPSVLVPLAVASRRARARPAPPSRSRAAAPPAAAAEAEQEIVVLPPPQPSPQVQRDREEEFYAPFPNIDAPIRRAPRQLVDASAASIEKQMLEHILLFARQSNVILKPIPTALLRTMRHLGGGADGRGPAPLYCYDRGGGNMADYRREDGHKPTRAQAKFYNHAQYKVLLDKILRTKVCGESFAEGVSARENVSGQRPLGQMDYANNVMCLVMSDYEMGVVAIRPKFGDNDYDVLGISFYHPYKTAKNKRDSHPLAGAGDQSMWVENLTKKDLDQYGEVELICAKPSTAQQQTSGVGRLLMAYTLYDLWRRRKKEFDTNRRRKVTQRYKGVLLDVSTFSNQKNAWGENRQQQTKNRKYLNFKAAMESDAAHGLATKTYRDVWKFQHRFVGTQGNHDLAFWYKYSEKPGYYMFLDGPQWQGQALLENIKAQLKISAVIPKLCAKGQKGRRAGEAGQRNIKGGRGGGCK